MKTVNAQSLTWLDEIRCKAQAYEEKRLHALRAKRTVEMLRKKRGPADSQTPVYVSFDPGVQKNWASVRR